MNPSDILTSFSLAIYSQWFYHKPTHCLFDAGEGVATALGKKVAGVQNVFISHGHEDHIAGISNLVNIRNIVTGEYDRPLNIYYPLHDPWVNALIEYIEKKQSGLIRYPLYVQPLEPGDGVEIEGAKRPTRVVAFEMQHARGRLCLGYEIEQERSVLDEFTGQSVYRYHPIFLYTGDGFEPYFSPRGRVDMAVHEATFLARDVGEAAARVEHRHSTVETAVDWGASEDVKILILCHISDRYSIDEAIQAAVVARVKYAFRGDLYIAYCDRIIEVAKG